MPSVVDAEFQEFVRQAGSFAVEVNSLTKRLAAIVQEMRIGIAPFRLEGITGIETQDSPGPVSGSFSNEARATSSGNLISNR